MGDGRSGLDRLTASPVEAAPLLLGARLTRDSDDGPVTVRITEVEAYHGESDPGSHAFRGRTPRTAPMFGAAGHAYVYFSYGMHTCLNIVCGPDGTAGGCLVRAGEVVAGADLAGRRRAANRRAGAGAIRPHELARGPGNLARALGVLLEDSGHALDEAPFALELPAAPEADAVVRRGLRVGLAAPGGLEPYDWRFSLAGEPSVSAYTPHRTVREHRRGLVP